MNAVINEEVRKTAKNAKVPLWAIADVGDNSRYCR